MRKDPMLKAPQNSLLFPLHVEELIYKVRDEALINGLSFSVQETGITAIMGPNGAGKSLTLRLLHGLIKPCAGRISWGDHKELETVRAHQAMVFQKPILLRRTVIDNLRYALKIKGVKDKAAQSMLIDQALERAKLSALVNSPARQLSGGEQQRLAMARALLHRPAILFLDEPTSSLDPNATKAVEELILTASAEGSKIIMVTHDIGQARRLSDEILFMHDGKLAEQGATSSVLDKPKSVAAQQFYGGEIVSTN